MEMGKKFKFANSLPFGPKKTSNFRNNLVNFLCAIENFSPAQSEVIFSHHHFPCSVKIIIKDFLQTFPSDVGRNGFKFGAKMCYANDTAAAANSWL